MQDFAVLTILVAAAWFAVLSAWLASEKADVRKRKIMEGKR
jgi:hypothetical protein